MTNDDKHASNDAQNGPAEEVEVEEVVAEPVDEPAEPAARGRGARSEERRVGKEC